MAYWTSLLICIVGVLQVACDEGSRPEDDFYVFDADGNKKLDAWEIIRGYQGYLSSKSKFEFFRDVDTNSDGIIDLDEYREFVYKN